MERAYLADVLLLVARSQADQAVDEIDELLMNYGCKHPTIGVEYLGKDEITHCQAGLHIRFRVTAPSRLINSRVWERANTELSKTLHRKFSVQVEYSILLGLDPIE